LIKVVVEQNCETSVKKPTFSAKNCFQAFKKSEKRVEKALFGL